MTLNNVELFELVKERVHKYGLSCSVGGIGPISSPTALVYDCPVTTNLDDQLYSDLNAYLRQLGLTRRSMYQTYAIKRALHWSTLGSKDKEIPEITNSELSFYKQALLFELEQMPNLKTVAIFGGRALQCFLDKTDISKRRGSVYDYTLPNGRVIKLVCLRNPFIVRKQAINKIMFKQDCVRLSQVINNTFIPHIVEAKINPTFEEVLTWIDKFAADKKPIAVDIETRHLTVMCIGLANSTTSGICINFANGDLSPRWTLEEHCAIIKKLAALLGDPTTKLVLQNGAYDATFLHYFLRLKLAPIWFDTMLAHHLIYPKLPHNLGHITTQYTNHPYYKDEGTVWKDTGDVDAEWIYNVKDCCVTLAASELMLNELQVEKLDDVFFNHIMRLQPHLIEMTVLGLKVDTSQRDIVAKELEEDIENCYASIIAMVRELLGDPEYTVNIKSTKQLAKLLFDELKLIGKGRKVDKESREFISTYYKNPDFAPALMDLLDTYATKTKFYSTYATSAIDEDGRVRSQYKQAGVVNAPGRLSSSENGWFTGTNMQNQPPQAQKFFVADEGCAFSYFDLGQAEARCVGWRYDIKEWQNQFELARTDSSGYDAHRALATLMFNVPYDEVPKEDIDADGKPTIRYIAKRCRHGLNYRMQAPRLAGVLKVHLSTANKLFQKYHRITPELQKGWADDITAIKRDKKMANAYGRIFRLMEEPFGSALDAIIAFYHQSTIGDKVSRVIYLCHEDPEWPTGKARICLTIHDALIAIHVADEEIGKCVRRIMNKHALEPINITTHAGKTIPLIIPADFKKSFPDEHGVHRWSNLEKVKDI